MISPFGVGALVDIDGASYIGVDTTHWPPGSHRQIRDCELARMLRRPIHAPHNNDTGIPYYRFPRWLFCPRCRAMTNYTAQMEVNDRSQKRTRPACTQCRVALTPMGFVSACENGHIQDVDWHYWVHRGVGNCAPDASRLSFVTTGSAGGDWSSMHIRCASCGKSKSFEGLTTQSFPGRCGGRQPWQKADQRSNCDKEMRVFRRGNSNLYYANILSAIDINTRAAGQDLQVRDALATKYQSDILLQIQLIHSGSLSEDIALRLSDQKIVEVAQDNGWQVDVVRNAYIGLLRGTGAESAEGTGEAQSSQEDILRSEWDVLGRSTSVNHENLIINPYAVAGLGWPRAYERLFKQVSLVKTLREVRALAGFRRISPDSGSPLVKTALGAGAGQVRWLPGIEVRGEGILIVFNEDCVSAWERGIGPRMTGRLERMAAKCSEFGRDRQIYATCRFIALHTFAHALIRRLSFDAGYAASSLRERIYSAPGVAGILIYTADGDSEGSLGGLVRMGEPARLVKTIAAGLADASWCSSDPVCRESVGVGIAGLNAAACHACALVSETSCVANNTLLDRRLLVGNPGVDPLEGLAWPLVEQAG